LRHVKWGFSFLGHKKLCVGHLKLSLGLVGKEMAWAAHSVGEGRIGECSIFLVPFGLANFFFISYNS